MKYILIVLNVFSRFAWALPLKNKGGDCVKTALNDNIKTFGRKPYKIWSDNGTEFYNVNVGELLKKYDIKLYSTHNEPKASIAERFIRTLRGKIESNFIIT